MLPVRDTFFFLYDSSLIQSEVLHGRNGVLLHPYPRMELPWS